jgi:Zn-dependent protease with chaperone function
VFAGLFSVLLLNTGPLSGFWKRSDSDGVDLFPLLPVLVVLFVGVPVDAVVGPPDWVSAGFSLVVFGLYWFGEEKVVGFSESWQESIVKRSKALPYVVAEYSVFVLMMSVPLLIFLFLSYSPVVLRLLAGDVPVLFAYALLSSVAWVGAVWVTYRRSYEYTRVSYDLGGQRGGRVARRGFGVFAVFVSLFVGGLGWLFFSRVRVLFSMDMLAGVVVALSGGWPILFVVGGLLYQYVGLLRMVLLTSVRGEPRDDLCEGIDLEADVYVLESDLLVLGAVSTGFSDFVVVSEAVVEELDGSELDAVLAHEESHVVSGDSRLAFLTGLFSPLLLTGKNVLFSALGFGRRELEADRYAAERVGDPDQVIEALVAVEDLELRSVANGGLGVVPTMASFGSSPGRSFSGFERVFGFFYGDFGLTMAHPSTEKREEELRGYRD